MPTYEYVCESCRHVFELLQKISDPPCDTCPECGGTVRKLISGGAGIIMKGSGPSYCRESGESRNTSMG